ncbi:MAG: hypothetical protein M3Y83_00030 [Actinomycetota bacterium]|nr:hypothetical protein [Actinomycetota bacterium]
MSVALLVAGLLTACSEQAGDGGEQGEPRASASGSVWVANEGADSLTVIDAATDAVVTTVEGVKAPHNVQLGSGGDIAYTVSGSTNTVVAIDTATYAVHAVAPTGPAPAHVIEAPNGNVYVTNAGDGTVSVYRGPELAPVATIDVGGMPHGLRAAANGSVIVVANMEGRLDLIDPTTNSLTGSVPVGTEPVQVAVSADGRYVYSSVSEPPKVVKVDLTTQRVVGSTDVPTPPVQVYLSAEEDAVLSANQGTAETPGRTVSVIDTETMTPRAVVEAGSGPHGVVIDDSAMRAWVTNTFDDTVSAIDLDEASVSATIPVGHQPNGISYSPRPPAAASAPTMTVNLPAPEQQSGHGHGH